MLEQNVIQIDRFPKLESRIAQLEFFIVLLFKGKFALTKEARKFIRALKEADVVLHAPGGPSIGDTYFKAEKLYLWRLNLIRRMGIPYIFYAPSIGSCILQNGEYYKKNKKFKEICKNIPENERIILFVATGYYKNEFSYAMSLRKNVEDVTIMKERKMRQS